MPQKNALKTIHVNSNTLYWITNLLDRDPHNHIKHFHMLPSNLKAQVPPNNKTILPPGAVIFDGQMPMNA